MLDNVIFREYDIRGVYNEQFDTEFAYKLGRAHISYIKKHLGVSNPRVSVGFDARLSGPEISESLIKGMVESGAQVYEIGLVTTPISYFSTFSMELSGAIMVTGSHNPPEYNGFKISVGPSTIYGESIQELRQIIEAEDYVDGEGSREKYDIFPEYIERYSKEFGQFKDIPVVLDCGNGAAGCAARRLFEAVGLKPIILFEEPDGRFPNHHPDPTVEKNLVDLKKAVKEHGAMAGIGFDGDCDRIGLVDDQGVTIMGDEMMAIVSRDLLSETKGLKIIGDVKCSDRLFADVEKHGGEAIMWKTGHSLVKQKIKDEKAPFGGELSGHIFFADRNYGYDDALYAGLRMVEILAKTGKTFSQLLEGFGEAYNTPELRIDTTEEKKHQIVNLLIDEFSKPSDEYKANLIDGVRLSFADGWALARPSNTQPVLVLRFESSTEEGLQRIRQTVEQKIQHLL